MKPAILVLFIMLAAVGCNRSNPDSAAPAPESAAMPADKPAANAPADTHGGADMNADRPRLTAADRAADGPVAANPAAAEPAGGMPADNRAKDKETTAQKAMNPTENTADMAISQQARADVVKVDAMSTDAKNVQINTQDGVVTLHGPVATAREKKDVAAIVKRVDGVKRVDNQMEVAAK